MQGTGHGLPVPSFLPGKSSRDIHQSNGSPSTDQPVSMRGLNCEVSIWISFSNGLLHSGDPTPCKAWGKKVHVFIGLKYSDWKEGGATTEWLFPIRYGKDSQCRQEADSSAPTGQLAKAVTQLDQRSSIISGLNSFVSWWHKVRS